MNKKEPQKKLLPDDVSYHSCFLPFPQSVLVDITFASDITSDTSLARERLRKELVSHNLPQEIENGILLCLTEIMTNIYRHAKDKGTEIKCKIFEDEKGRLLLCLLDDSTPFKDFVKNRRKSIDRVDSETLYSEGFGLGLISKTFPDHEYCPSSERGAYNHFFIDLNISYDKAQQRLVYIVDDDPSLRNLIEVLLKSNYKTLCFSSALEALKKIAKVKPDLIISDLHMPDMDGIVFRKELDKVPNGSTIPFVFLSGNKDAAAHPYINRLGIDDYLFKPVKKEILLQAIERLLTRSLQLETGIKDTIGRDITALLQPKLPENLGNWSACVLSTMAEHGGGDFVVHKKIHDVDIIVLADVMGKGIQAKFFACAYAGYLRSFFQTMVDDVTSPQALLRMFSDFIAEDELFRHVLVTCQVVALKQNGECAIASAGHPLPHILHRDGRVEKIENFGPLPGLAGQAVYKEYQKILNEEEYLILNTDGLVEFTDLSKTELNGMVIQKNCDIHELAQTVWNVISTIESQQKVDDQTLVIFNYNRNQTKPK